MCFNHLFYKSCVFNVRETNTLHLTKMTLGQYRTELVMLKKGWDNGIAV